MIQAFQVLADGRLKIHWHDDEGDSVGEYDSIPASTVLQFPTPLGADITRAIVERGWTISSESGVPVWHRPGHPAALPAGTPTREVVALAFATALLALPHQARASVIDDAFDLPQRFLTRAEM